MSATISPPVVDDYLQAHWAVTELRGTAEDAAAAVRQIATAIRSRFPGSQASADMLAGQYFVATEYADVRICVGSRNPGRWEILALVQPQSGPRTQRLFVEHVAEVRRAALRVAFSTTEIASLHEQMPLTTSMPRRLGVRALAGVSPFLTVHHMTDFLVMVDAIRAMGVTTEAITVLDKGYSYRYTDRVDAHLESLGIRVYPWTEAGQALKDHSDRARAQGRRGLLVDDGGYTLPVLVDQLPHLIAEYCGLVEQTTSGITKLEMYGDDLPLPVFSVAESRLKATIESYGIADAACRNILRLLPDEKFEGRPALVLGFGRIGEQIAEVLRDRRMRVAVYDRETVRLVAAHERGFVTSRSLPELLTCHAPLLIVGSTGRTSLRGEHTAALRADCYLVSTTSRQAEFALDELTDEAVRVDDLGVSTRLHYQHGPTATVLAHGQPVNFYEAESLPNRYADLILASLLVGAAHLARPDHTLRPGHNVRATDRVLESSGLLEAYYARFGPSGFDRGGQG
ncbi:hypothetical protein GCM10023205_78920 [Yinghuangia aomiensis]|uniref:S-adenosyl-L-homocysteine hydrolase NAD binding domain-containing protein n=1 Tax=Yinghuangia aomiensis TaxID=676205 RepID=A0ABP9ICG4_9ACTN